VYIAAKDHRTPYSAKILAFVVAAYALSPIDLIPDFIPVLGLLDDLILLPAGISLVVRLIPQDLLNQFRRQARALDKPGTNRMAGIVIAFIWIGIIIYAARASYRVVYVDSTFL